jgi:5,10-methylenetetrahydromethanopterin reductase
MTAAPVGLGLLSHPDIRSMTDLARRAEERGFESVWVSETRISRDAVTGVTAVLLATRRVRVGSAAINVFTRAAGLVAVTWATLAEAGPGRVVLGLGGGSAVALAQQGLPFDHTVSRMREFTEAIRGAWTSPSPFTYDGRFVRLNQLAAEVRPHPVPPIYFCVAGPKALACAAELAQGVVCDAFLTPAYVRWARRNLDAAAAGRNYVGELAAALVLSVADTIAEAAAPLRPLLANYLVNFPELARFSGVDDELISRMRARTAAQGLAAAAQLLPDSVVAEHALCGTPGACRERVEEYRAAGVQLPILFPVGASLRTVFDLDWT